LWSRSSDAGGRVLIYLNYVLAGASVTDLVSLPARAARL
jgi:hypothetical protein